MTIDLSIQPRKS